jgi:CRISPR/Cas system-associated endonuclease/helicase Cas3
VNDDLFLKFKDFEDRRIQYEGPIEIANDKKLYQLIRKKCINKGKLKYNTCIVMNTVKSALAVANHFKINNKNIIVKHMSSCLAPYDRAKILQEIRELLQSDQKIMVVATSVVECGIDFSFQIGFREYGPFSSTIQFGGRINRNNEYPWGKAIEFILDQDFIDSNDEFSWNPMLNDAIEARRGYEVDIQNCTAVIENELELNSGSHDYVGMEAQKEFADLKEKFKVINTPTFQVIVDPEVFDKMIRGEIITNSEISMKSVNIYPTTLERFEDEENIEKQIIGEDEIFVFTGYYDPEFYGIYSMG